MSGLGKIPLRRRLMPRGLRVTTMKLSYCLGGYKRYPMMNLMDSS
jgi:hypothetical protein